MPARHVDGASSERFSRALLRPLTLPTGFIADFVGFGAPLVPACGRPPSVASACSAYVERAHGGLGEVSGPAFTDAEAGAARTTEVPAAGRDDLIVTWRQSGRASGGDAERLLAVEGRWR